MGGEAAKERRRLKRLEAQGGAADGNAAPSGGDKPTPPAPGAGAKAKGSGDKNSADVVRARLKRKLERKETGKFKAQTESTPTPPPNSFHKRKPEYANDRNSRPPRSNTFQKRNFDDGNKFRRPSDNDFKRGPNNHSSSNTFQRRNFDDGNKFRRPSDNDFKRGPNNHSSSNTFQKRNFDDANQPRRPYDNDFKRGPRDHSSGKDAPIRSKFRHEDDFKPAKKNDNVKQNKPKKPKHLKRKMENVSKSISEGAGIADLEGQMKELVKQMEEFKKLKQNKGVASNNEEVVAESA